MLRRTGLAAVHDQQRLELDGGSGLGAAAGHAGVGEDSGEPAIQPVRNGQGFNIDQSRKQAEREKSEMSTVPV